MTQEPITYGMAPSPYGKMIAARSPRGLCWLAFVMNTDGHAVQTMKKRLGCMDIRRDDQALKAWETMPLDLQGTDFQKAVWAALQDIPYGKTVTYKDIAQSIGKPGAMRAVGSAIGANPVSLRVPCHRVIRSDGGLGGYAWGLERKQAILESETQRQNKAA